VIVDSSALLAILREEPPAEQCLQTLLISPLNRIAAATFLEAAIVADRILLREGGNRVQPGTPER
jgi:uncharacterized protein with PIN domain